MIDICAHFSAPLYVRLSSLTGAAYFLEMLLYLGQAGRPDLRNAKPA
jgi:hypothetical protein